MIICDNDDYESLIIENTIVEEFQNFLNLNFMTRNKLIEENNFLKQKLIYNQTYFTSKINESKVKESSISNLNIINTTYTIPDGIFCYPIDENIRTEEEFELKHMKRIDSFSDFEKVMESVKTSMEAWFTDFPRNKDESERIDNKMYINWIWYKSLSHINSSLGSIEKGHFEIIEKIAKLLNKKFSAVYKVISSFFLPLLKKIKSCKKFQRFSTISKYRAIYCQICFKYLCNIHFYKHVKFENYRDTKIIKSELIKNSGKLKYLGFQAKINFDTGDFFKCEENEILCKLNQSNTINVSLSSFTYNNINEVGGLGISNTSCVLEGISDIYDLYLLHHLISSNIFSNSCFISKYIFNGKYKCNLIDKCILILHIHKSYDIQKYFESKMIKISDTNTTNLVGINHISNEKLESNYISDRKQSINNFPTYKNSVWDYVPCCHQDLCRKDNCECIKTKGYCNKFCNCKDYCDLMFKGCACKDTCHISEYNSKCVCVRENRECDPDICRCIHSNEENNFESKFCTNMSMNFSIKKKTCLSQSEICNYYGLFALEDIKENEYICEYTGELLPREESDRRSLFNDHLGLNYLFSLSDFADIDAFSVGSKMRYVNHSSFGYQNCYARANYVRGIYRIGLYAQRAIRKGEELYFDYMLKVNVPWLIKYNRYYANKK